ncbi:MAG: N-acetyltransferase [Candidatus Methanoperedens sp.]|nr:N-acetyltransferase [Candidatus Methanoperedens sp.]
MLDDIPSLVAIENQSFSRGDYPIGKRQFKFLIENRRVKIFIATINGEAAGYVCLLMRNKTAVVYSIAVSEKHRGNGLGRKLLEAAERQACKEMALIIRLEVSCTNRAVNLYKKHGYSKTGIIKDYYGAGADAFSMFKQVARQGGEEFEKINTGRYGCNPAAASTASG